MNHIEFVAWLKVNGACNDAIRWVRFYKYSMAEAWEACEAEDWMLWLARRTEMDLAGVVERLIPDDSTIMTYLEGRTDANKCYYLTINSNLSCCELSQIFREEAQWKSVD